MYDKSFLIKMAKNILQKGNMDDYSESLKGLTSNKLIFIVDGKRSNITISTALSFSKTGKKVKPYENVKDKQEDDLDIKEETVLEETPVKKEEEKEVKPASKIKPLKDSVKKDSKWVY